MKIEPTFRKPEIHPKIWGNEYWLVNNDKYCGKLLNINKGYKFSLHMHLFKALETFYLLRGSLIFRYCDYESIEKKEVLMKVGDVIDIPQACFHQIEALEDSTIIEISMPHREDDSFRLERSCKV